LWQQRLERAAYESERAARHYRLVEPEHRLVARQLAKEWEEKLTAHRQLQEDYQRFLQTQPQVLTRSQREAIEALAHNIPSLWHAPTTPVADRKEIVRQLIQRIIVAGEGLSERVQITIEWAGGGTTAGIATRPISQIENLSSYPQLCERIRRLAEAGYRSGRITEYLAEEGFHSPKYARPFSRQSVIELRRRLGVHQPHRRQRPALQENEWWFSDLQCELDCSISTLHLWRQGGWIQAYRHEHGRCWVAVVDAADLQRLRQRRAVPASHKTHNVWLDAQSSQRTMPLDLTTR
jgi:hypothetical protein